MSNNFRRKKRGISLVELVVVAAIISVLLAIAVPNFLKLRQKVNRDRCISNLHQIKATKEQWALESKKDIGDSCTAADLDPYLHEDIWDEDLEIYTTGHELICPDDPNGENATFGTSYTINNYGTDPECKIKGDHEI